MSGGFTEVVLEAPEVPNFPTRVPMRINPKRSRSAIAQPDVELLSGRPHFGHTLAAVLTSWPQSRHFFSAMGDSVWSGYFFSAVLFSGKRVLVTSRPRVGVGKGGWYSVVVGSPGVGVGSGRRSGGAGIDGV
jgi:hypothetical protein